MGIAFSDKIEKKFQELLKHYPNQQATLLPTLYLAQDEWGYLSAEAMEYVATRLSLSPSHVRCVATFYTMFKKKPTGTHHIQVCTNISCALRGAYGIVRKIEEILGIKVGETTADGLFTLEEVECLASCGTAPTLQLNDDYHEDLTNQSVTELLESLMPPEEMGDTKNH